MSDAKSTKSATKDVDQLQLATVALEEFNSNNYGTCLQNLGILEVAFGSSTKIMQNKAVAEFYKGDFKRYEQFRQRLNELIGDVSSNNNDDVIDIKDIAILIPLFNKSILLYQLRQPLAALKILLVLLKHLDLVETVVAQRIGLLAINILLNLNQPRKAEAVIDLVVARMNANTDFMSDEDEYNDLLLDKPKDGSKLAKPLNQFRWMFRLAKLRSKVMNHLNILIPAEESPEMLVLKAHQYYAGHDYQMAAKELAKKIPFTTPSFIKNGEDYNTIIANNMGLIHFHVRHYAMAVRFFQHALTFDQSAVESVGPEPPLHALGATKRPEILYNLGIAMLHLQRPKEAFECLLVPLNYHHNNPKLWLRLAEACIMVHKQNLKTKERKNIVSSVIGSGIHRKYIIHPTPPKYVSDDNESFAIPSTNLEFASLCLRNALTLVEHFQRQFDWKSDLQMPSKYNWEEITETAPCNPSKSLTLDAFMQLKYAVLAAYSYVQICLGEYLLALKYGQELASTPNLPDAYAMLAHLYCAESLIMLNRCGEARAYLEPRFITELKEDDFIHRGSPDWNINSLNAAQSILEYNLCVLLVLQGETEVAKAIINRCTHPIVFTHLKMLKIYMELKAGNFETCRFMIRIDTPQYT